MKILTDLEVLDLQMESSETLGDYTIRDHLKLLLSELWNRREGFSGKRPLGDSGWERELYAPLLRAGVVAGTLDGEGFIHNVDELTADAIIARAIQTL